MSDLKDIRVTSPKGIAHYPALVKPDTKYDENGVYKTGLILDKNAEGVSKFLKQIDELAEAAHAQKTKGMPKPKAAKIELYVPYEDEYDDEGEETGRVIVKFKSKASGTGKKGFWERKIPLFDAQPKKIPHGSIEVWGGSEIKIDTTVHPFESPKSAGCTLWIEAVQILKLVNGSNSSSAAPSGFGAEEDGFDSSGLEAAAEEETNEGFSAEEDFDEEDDF